MRRLRAGIPSTQPALFATSDSAFTKIPGRGDVILALELGQKLGGEHPGVLVEALAALDDRAAGIVGVELDAGQEHLRHRHEGVPGPSREPVFRRRVFTQVGVRARGCVCGRDRCFVVETRGGPIGCAGYKQGAKQPVLSPCFSQVSVVDAIDVRGSDER